MSAFSEQYSDEYGMTIDAIRELLQREESSNLQISPKIIEVEENKAISWRGCCWCGPQPMGIHFTELEKQQEWKIVSQDGTVKPSQ